MGVYEAYKPLRNRLRRVRLVDSLAVIYAYFQNLQFRRPIPNDIQVDDSYAYARYKPDKGVYEWDLETLVREVILNSPEQSASAKSFRNWSEFAKAINDIKSLDEDISLQYRDRYKNNILMELYRITQRQFPWQRSPDASVLSRNFHIFGDSAIDSILIRRIHLTSMQLYTLGLALIGHHMESFVLNCPPQVKIPGLDSSHIETFFSRFAIEMPILRDQVGRNQSYDEDYLYAFNPLKMRPLVWLPNSVGRLLIAPIPTYLFNRITEGVYYEIFDDPSFADAFGNSFQKYVGDAAQVVARQGVLNVLGEEEYFVGKDRKDSVDWIVFDDNGALFVECKTKRLRYGAKISLAVTDVLNDDLEKMAGFVIQVYRTQADCASGHYPHWTQANRQIFPMIVTLEDWYAFGDRIIVQELDRRISAGLEQRAIDTSIVDTSPYTICSVADFERAIQIMAGTGIQRFMRGKTSGEKRLWTLHSYMGSEFPEEFRSARRCLLEEDNLPFQTR